MRRRPGSPPTIVSGLVPMADMLSNTVGIVLFILAFTVLQTSGVFIPKRLPMERENHDRTAVFFVCYNNRLLPLDSGLQEQLLEDLGEPTFDNAKSWVERFKRRRAEDGFFTVEPEGKAVFSSGGYQGSVRLVLSAAYTPRTGVGDTRAALGTATSVFDQQLRSLSKGECFCYFMVCPDSIELFRQARNHAESQYGISSGWSPTAAGEPIKFSLSGGGGGITPTDQ